MFCIQLTTCYHGDGDERLYFPLSTVLAV